jgi:hypothetical protein
MGLQIAKAVQAIPAAEDDRSTASQLIQLRLAISPTAQEAPAACAAYGLPARDTAGPPNSRVTRR